MSKSKSPRTKFAAGTTVLVAGQLATIVDDFGLDMISVRYVEPVQGCRPIVCVKAALAVEVQP